MRSPKTEAAYERAGLVAIVVACVAWILWHDAMMLFPLMGVVGGLLAMQRK